MTTCKQDEAAHPLLPTALSWIPGSPTAPRKDGRVLAHQRRIGIVGPKRTPDSRRDLIRQWVILKSWAVDGGIERRIVRPMISEAEIKIGDEWVTIDFAEGVKRRGQRMRCPACHGLVNAYDGGGSVPHFAHYRRHDHCPLYYQFSGTPKMHPEALS